MLRSSHKSWGKGIKKAKAVFEKWGKYKSMEAHSYPVSQGTVMSKEWVRKCSETGTQINTLKIQFLKKNAFLVSYSWLEKSMTVDDISQ